MGKSDNSAWWPQEKSKLAICAVIFPQNSPDSENFPRAALVPLASFSRSGADWPGSCLSFFLYFGVASLSSKQTISFYSRFPASDRLQGWVWAGGWIGQTHIKNSSSDSLPTRAEG